jgi:hypothetical protein
MKTIKVFYFAEIPENFTGIAEYPNGTKRWYKEGNLHREDGPAIEWADGAKAWFLEDINYPPTDPKDYVVLDYYQGKYDLMWYKLLDKNDIFEYPDIPGLFKK